MFGVKEKDHRGSGMELIPPKSGVDDLKKQFGLHVSTSTGVDREPQVFDVEHPKEGVGPFVSGVETKKQMVPGLPSPRPELGIQFPKRSVVISPSGAYQQIEYKTLGSVHIESQNLRQQISVAKSPGSLAEAGINPTEPSPTKIESDRDKAKSHAIFAWKLFRKLFTEKEFTGKNVNGKAGKGKLDESKMLTIRKNVFRWWPSTKSEEARVWRNCEIAIDTWHCATIS